MTTLADAIAAETSADMRSTTGRSADSSSDLHPLLAERWSPRAFDDAGTVSADDLSAILEAARWAPSANNIQPWRFLVVRRGDEDFEAVVSTLKGANPAWAPRAAVLVVAVAQQVIGGREHPIALYDLGGAVAQLTVQARALGLYVHQMGGFDRQLLRDALAIPADFSPVTVVAVGHVATAEVLPEHLAQRETAPRERRALAETVHAGRWGAVWGEG